MLGRRGTEETGWPQIVEWYDELLTLTGNPVVALNRAVAAGEADGGWAGLRALEDVPADLPRRVAAEAHLRERTGDTAGPGSSTRLPPGKP